MGWVYFLYSKGPTSAEAKMKDSRGPTSGIIQQVYQIQIQIQNVYCH